MLEGQATSIGELLREVQRVTRIWSPSLSDPAEIWFRGQGRRRHRLLPALYREDVQRFHYDEGTLFERFRVLAAPYVHRQPADDWDWYFLARHHGLPSRLLDWSESLIIASFFAVSEHIRGRTRLDVDRQLERERERPTHDGDSPCVWMLDAGTLNKNTCGEDLVFVPGGSRTERYLPESLSNLPDSSNEFPIAILPPRTNERITAQQGVFTLHGHSTLALDQLRHPTAPEPIKLACISLDRSSVCHLWYELQLLGMGPLSLFPELDSVAAHVSWICQSTQ